MVAICIDNSDFNADLSVGVGYDIMKDNGNHFLIKDDFGERGNYLKSRFIVIKKMSYLEYKLHYRFLRYWVLLEESDDQLCILMWHARRDEILKTLETLMEGV